MAGTVRYEVTKADYASMTRLGASPTRRSVAVAAAVLAVGVLVAAAAGYGGGQSVRTAAIILIGAAVGYLVGGYVGGKIHAEVQIWRDFPHYRKLNGPVELGWDDRGLRLTAARGNVAYEWQDLVGFRENRRVLVLCPQRRIGIPVPKSAFEDAAALDDFRARLQAGVHPRR